MRDNFLRYTRWVLCAAMLAGALVGFLAYVRTDGRVEAAPQDTATTLASGSKNAAVPAEVAALVDQLFTAVRERDRDAVTARIDVPRLLREIERQKLLGQLTPADRTSLRIALHTLIGGGLVQE